MFRLVGQVRPPVLHLGDLGLGIDRRPPILVREGLVLALTVQPDEIVCRGCLDATFLGHARRRSLRNAVECHYAHKVEITLTTVHNVKCSNKDMNMVDFFGEPSLWEVW